MNNYVQKGCVISVTAPADVSAGDPVIVGSLFGIATRDALTGASVDIQCDGVVTITGDSGISFAVGDRVFWDAANSWVDKTATAQLCVGVAVSAKGATAGTVNVRLGGVTPAGT